MNPMTLAKQFGYSPDQVLKFLKNFSPEMGKKIEQALMLGYTGQEVMDWLGRSIDTSIPKGKRKTPAYEKVLSTLGDTNPEAIKQKRAQEENQISEIIGPTKALGALGGAAAGFAVGGPVGAVSGGLGGLQGFEDLFKRYEAHKAKGGQLGLSDWLKSVVKGAGTAVIGTKAGQLLNAMKGMVGNGPDTDNVQAEEAISEEPNEESRLQKTDQGLTPQEAFEAVSSKGAGNLFQSIAGQVQSSGQINLALNKLYGNRFIKDLQIEHGEPGATIIDKAFQFVKGQGNAPDTQQQATADSKDIQAEQNKSPIPSEQTDIGVQESFDTVEPGITAKNVSIDQTQIPEGLRPVFERPTDTGTQKQIGPIKSMLKSSNTIGATFDSDSNRMRIVFAPKSGGKGGSVYEYPNVDKETFEKITGGKARPITEGSSKFGVWYHGKNPSAGAAFSKNVKKFADKYPPEKQEPESYSATEKQILGSARTFLASDLFKPFERQRTRGRQKTMAQVLKEREPLAKQADDELLTDIVAYLEEKLNLKNPPTATRLQKELRKEFM